MGPIATPLPEWVSPSSLEKYENCPLSYYLLNVERLPDKPGEAAVLGTFVHLVLEHLLEREPDQRTLEVARALAGEHFPEYQEHRDFMGLELDDAAVKAFKLRSWSMIQNYFALENPADVVQEGAEQWVRGRVGNAPVRGIIDRLDRTESGLVVADYKTGKPPAAKWAGEKFKAMNIYAVLCESVIGERPSSLRLLFLAGPVDFVRKVDDKVLEATVDRVNRLWDGITHDYERGEFQPTPNRLCDWCAAKPYCPAWGGDIAVGVGIARHARVSSGRR